jgi:hypothetical protein
MAPRGNGNAASGLEDALHLQYCPLELGKEKNGERAEDNVKRSIGEFQMFRVHDLDVYILKRLPFNLPAGLLYHFVR